MIIPTESKADRGATDRLQLDCMVWDIDGFRRSMTVGKGVSVTCPTAPAKHSRRFARRCVVAILMFGAAGWANVAVAASVLQGITYKSLPDSSVELRINFFDGAPPSPSIFSTANPSLIAIDFPDTFNDLPRHQVGNGITVDVSRPAADNRTRVMVELTQPAGSTLPVKYKSHVEGQTLVLVVYRDQPVQTAAAGGSFTLVAGVSLQVQLEGWAKRAGWTTIWRVPDTWIVPGDESYGNDFETAVKRVVQELAANGADIVGDSWRGNHTIVISQNGASE